MASGNCLYFGWSLNRHFWFCFSLGIGLSFFHTFNWFLDDNVVILGVAILLLMVFYWHLVSLKSVEHRNRIEWQRCNKKIALNATSLLHGFHSIKDGTATKKRCTQNCHFVHFANSLSTGFNNTKYGTAITTRNIFQKARSSQLSLRNNQLNHFVQNAISP